LKRVVEYFLDKGILFESVSEIDKKLLNTRKKISILSLKDSKQKYHSIYIVAQKSRFLIKNALELIEIDERLQKLENHNFKYKHLMISEAICSKAVQYFKDKGWQLHHDFM